MGVGMPTEPAVWVVLIVVAGIVVALALWLGRGLKVKTKSIDLEIKEGKAADADPGVTVFEDAKVGKTARVGSITGVRSQEVGSRQKVDVAGRAEIEGTVGDITGVEFSKKPPKAR
jgi:preprotein translocase subunit SecF